MFSLGSLKTMSGRLGPTIFSRNITILPPQAVPAPLENVKTPEEFLKIIARDTVKFAPKFKDWNHLFTVNGIELKELGIPVKQRRWILRWTSKMRMGIAPYYIKPSAKKTKKK